MDINSTQQNHYSTPSYSKNHIQLTPPINDTIQSLMKRNQDLPSIKSQHKKSQAQANFHLRNFSLKMITKLWSKKERKRENRKGERVIRF